MRDFPYYCDVELPWGYVQLRFWTISETWHEDGGVPGTQIPQPLNVFIAKKNIKPGQRNDSTFILVIYIYYIIIYISIYIYIYIYLYIYIYIYVYLYISIYLYIYISIYIPSYHPIFRRQYNQDNVSSWLVARVAIVANFFQIILKLMYCLEGSLLWQNKIGRALFLKKKCNCWEASFFSKTLWLSQVFAHLSIWACKCISIWVGLFAGFTIAASCARAAPGSPEGKQAFSKIAKFKLQAFPKRTNPLLNPY